MESINARRQNCEFEYKRPRLLSSGDVSLVYRNFVFEKLIRAISLLTNCLQMESNRL